MIYTCTTNPSLDYYVTLEDNQNSNDVKRSIFETYDCGGKGINVSIILSNLNIPSNTIGFLGGFTKDYYVSFLAKYPYIQPMFTTIKGNTRINVKLMGDDMTSINAKGPKISKEEFEKLKSRVNRIYNDDIFVLCGNVQEEIRDDISNLVHELANDGIKTVLDCSEEVIDKCLDIKPFLVNATYLIKDDDDEETIIKKMLEVNEKGVSNVLVCERNKPSYLCFDKKVYKCEAAKNESYVTGYVDALIGGFLFTVVRGGDSLEAFTYGQAACVATSLSNDLAARNKIEEVSKTIEIIKL